MPQSLLGLLALSLAALLGFSQQRATIQSYEVRIRDEYSVAAAGMVMHVMEMGAARSFDEATTPEGVKLLARLPQVADFSLPLSFGNAGTCDLLEPWRTPSCDDIDDLHGIENAVVEVPLSSGRKMTFEVSISVEYVADDDITVPVGFPTNNKRVTISARSGEVPRLGQIVQLERVIAYDPVKAEAEYELLHGPLVSLEL